MKEFREQSVAADSQSIEQRIIELFHKTQGDVISGEKLADTLGISRTAVWKRIATLKDLGYRIDTVPSRGYRFLASPDLLIPSEIMLGLKTDIIARKIVYCKETGSTNTVADKLAEEGAEEGTVVLAERQHQGKGRLGRQWESPFGVNLYCSIILRPDILPFKAPQLTFLSAVAVAQAVEETTTLIPRIKWPNDILVNGRKVAGLLNEMSSETEKIHYVILGIGVNLNMRREQFPEELRHPATSLYLEGGVAVNRLAFARALFTSFDRLYGTFLKQGYAPVRAEWLERSAVFNRKVRIVAQEGECVGMAMGIDDDGALLLRRSDGSTERILSGDVSILE